jgi:molybdenum cofactor biosynthesis enzyme MoaA
MTAQEFSLVLDKLKGHTQFIYYHLMGEPLTHPLLPDFLKTANEKGFKSIITTNGTLLKKRSEELLNSPLHKINVSKLSKIDSASAARF